tara:strand:+ start:267 stop:461 length:195 start_codon:yes stop_codon:yes gene_type:complete
VKEVKVTERLETNEGHFAYRLSDSAPGDFVWASSDEEARSLLGEGTLNVAVRSSGNPSTSWLVL